MGITTPAPDNKGIKQGNQLSIVAIIIAGIGLLISGYGLILSNEANNKAGRANEIATIEKRPVLNVEAAIFKENNSYILAKEKDGALEIMVQFEIYNSGGITAEDIEFPSGGLLRNLKDNSANPMPIEEIPGIQDITPGNRAVFPAIIRLEWSTENERRISDALNDIEKNQFPFLIELPLSYLSAVDRSQKIMIDSRFRFNKDLVIKEKFDIIFPDFIK